MLRGHVRGGVRISLTIGASQVVYELSFGRRAKMLGNRKRYPAIEKPMSWEYGGLATSYALTNRILCVRRTACPRALFGLDAKAGLSNASRMYIMHHLIARTERITRKLPVGLAHPGP